MDSMPQIEFEKIGLIGTLGVFLVSTVVAFVREWVVPGSRYREKVLECQALRASEQEHRTVTMKTLEVCEMMRSLIRRHGMG